VTSTINDLPFREIWLHDFEFISRPGGHYDVVCLAARELRTGRTITLWREPGQQIAIPYPIDAGALFVCFAAHAELPETPRAFVGIWLLHLAWKAGKLTFALPNGRLEAHGVSRKVKRGVLHKLEAAGLIKVDRRRGKSPLITLLHL
jgi:hypothetical protein